MNSIDSFNQITFAIPVRQFHISSSVTVNESLPKVTEFILRLIRLCGGIETKEILNYFGLSDRETRLILDSLLDQTLIRFDGDVVQLTEYAESKFYTDDDLPRFSVVKARTDSVTFDLITFHPTEARRSASSLAFKVELPINETQVAQSTRLAEQAYQRHFQRILRAKEKGNDKIEIYKISNVQNSKAILDRTVDVSFKLDANQEVERTISFDEDATEEYRLGIESAISDALKRPMSLQHNWIAEFAERFDDKLLGQYLSNKSFDFSSYVRDVHIDEKVRYGGSTYPILGNIYMPENAERFLASFADAMSSVEPALDAKLITSIAWLAPDYRFWGRSIYFSDLYRKLEGALHQSAKTKPVNLERVKLLCHGTQESRREIFQQYWSPTEKSVHVIDGEVCGGRVEIILVPTKLACVLFHYAPPGNSAALVPIGFVTRNPQLIRSAQKVILDVAGNGKKYLGKATQHTSKANVDSFQDNFGFIDYCSI